MTNEPKEPATREDVENAKRDIIKSIVKMDDSVENMRKQNSAEHGNQLAKLLHLTEILHWVRAKWERFTRVPDPNDKPPPPSKPG